MPPAFAVGQRWISESEPELGLGRISSIDGRFVSITFPAHATTRRYAIAAAPLRRIRFNPGDSVHDNRGRRYQITAVEEPVGAGLIVYRCGHVELVEDQLADTLSVSTPLQRLLNGIVDGTADFDRRAKMLQLQAELRQSPVTGFVGGRIDLLPHQLFIANSVANARLPRGLLADETGLGKTIEACLILHRLIVSGKANRALVLVPESLVHQWFVELLRRFNLSFRLFTQEYFEGASDGDNPFLDDQLCLCSMELLSATPSLAGQAVEAGWDLVIVDEAHHLTAASRPYQIVKQLSQTGCGLLLLTATPEQLGREDHFSRLQLLDPHRYTTFDKYEEENRRLNALSDYIENFLAERRIDLSTTSPASIQIPLPSGLSPAPDASPAASDSPRTISLEQLIDLYGTGRVVFRNTRRVITGFPRRDVYITELDADQQALARIQTECRGDILKGSIPPVAVAADDPRVEWLVGLGRERADEKILIICTTKEKALSLKNVLQARIKVDIALFHEEMTLLQRDRNAAWFAEPEGARLLICSETGSEGRNFQFCQNLALFDLPLSPELLEQRIGRLDRIGQAGAIRIHVPSVKGSYLQVLSRWYHEGLDAFAHNIPSAGRVFEAVQASLLNILKAPRPDDAGGGTSIVSLIEQTRQSCRELSEQLLKARDRLLEISSLHPHISQFLIDTIRAADRRGLAAEIMAVLFKFYGIVVDEAGKNTFALITEFVTDHAFPLPRAERPIVTYDRDTALVREEVEFLTIDHPMVTGAMDLYLSADHGRSCFAVWIDNRAREVLLEATYVIECIAPGHLNADRFLPPTPLRVLTNHEGHDLTAKIAGNEYQSSLRNVPINRLLSNRTFTENVLPRMRDTNSHFASERARAVIAQAVAVAGDYFDREVKRLQSLPGDPLLSEEVTRLTAERDSVVQLLSSARLRLDAIRLIRRGPQTELKASPEEPEE